MNEFDIFLAPFTLPFVHSKGILCLQTNLAWPVSVREIWVRRKEFLSSEVTWDATWATNKVFILTKNHAQLHELISPQELADWTLCWPFNGRQPKLNHIFLSAYWSNYWSSVGIADRLMNIISRKGWDDIRVKSHIPKFEKYVLLSSN
jgi:hypothetical protein